jgi:hypothetical protein
MLRCGPSGRTFAARAKFDDERTHSVRTNGEFAAAARRSASAELSFAPATADILYRTNSTEPVIETQPDARISYHASAVLCSKPLDADKPAAHRISTIIFYNFWSGELTTLAAPEITVEEPKGSH